MAQLCFKPDFDDAIRQGRKTTTLRRWKNPRASPGQRIFAPRIGWLQILQCDLVQLDQLLETDAQSDGFDSLAGLFAALKRLYPLHAVDGKSWFRVAFSLEQPAGSSPFNLSQRSRNKPFLPIKTRPSSRKARLHLMRQIRLELDKAVQQSGSLFPL